MCCLDIPLSGNPPGCVEGAGSTQCEPLQKCPTTFPQQQFSCNGDDQVHLCNTSKDCPEQFYNLCCTFPSDAGSVSFCANTQIAQFGHGTCQ